MTQTLLERRRIEAEFAKGIFDVLAEDVGCDRAIEILVKTVVGLAKSAGAAFAGHAQNGRADLTAYAEILSLWQENGALTLDLKTRDANRLEFDVTRCRYAEMYRELGMAELGAVLSCNRDGAFCIGFNPDIRLTRTQTIMQGADRCDFRYTLETAGKP
jgi:hypothetical protein